MFGKKNKKTANEETEATAAEATEASAASGEVVKTGHDGKNRVVTWSKNSSGHIVGCPEIGKCEEGLTEEEAEKFFEAYCANTQNQ